MLAIKPGDRPTATGALRNPWVTGLTSDNEEIGSDKDESIRSHGGSTLSRKNKNRLPSYNEPRGKSEGGLITQESAKCMPGGTDFGANTGLEIGGVPTISQSSFDTSAMTLSDAAPTESLLVQTGPRESGLVSRGFQATRSRSPKRVRKKHVRNTPELCHQSKTQNTTLTLLTKLVTKNRALNPRPRPSNPRKSAPRRGNFPQSTARTNSPTEHPPKKTDKAHASIATPAQ